MNREPATAEGWSDRRVELVIGRLLQVGVLVAAAVVAVGGAALLVQHGGTPVDYSVFREDAALSSITSIVEAMRMLDSRAVIQFGLLLLIATPVARVFLTLIAFLIKRDAIYVAITAVVLILLLYGLLGGQV